MKTIFGQDLEEVYNDLGENNIIIPPGGTVFDAQKRIRDLHNKRLYNYIEWEIEVPNKPGGLSVLYETYDHETRLRDTEWSRAPTPQEMSSLAIAHFEGNIPRGSDLKKLMDNIERTIGEYYSHALQYKDNVLCVYEYAKGLVYDEIDECYNIPDTMWYQNRVEFDAPKLKNDQNYYLKDLYELYPEIIEYFYTRSYDDLPDNLKECLIEIPSDSGVWPIGRHTANTDFGIGLENQYYTSRGVR